METVKLADDEYLGEDGLPYCKNCHTPRGVYYEEFGKILPTRCKCRDEAIRREEEAERIRQRKEQVERLRRNSVLGKLFYNCTFDGLTVTDGNRQQIEVCKRYCTFAGQMLKEGAGLYIFGAPGVGKTHLTACMGNSLCNGLYSVLFTSFIEIEGKLKVRFGDTYGQEQVIRQTEYMDFLFLDDLGTEHLKEGNSWLQSVMFDIVNRRYNAQKPIISSSNYNLPERVEQCNYEERTVHRLSELCAYPLEMNGENMRTLSAKAKYGKLQKLLGGTKNG